MNRCIFWFLLFNSFMLLLRVYLYHFTVLFLDV